jgi:hypothetical protein
MLSSSISRRMISEIAGISRVVYIEALNSTFGARLMARTAACRSGSMEDHGGFISSCETFTGQLLAFHRNEEVLTQHIMSNHWNEIGRCGAPIRLIYGRRTLVGVTLKRVTLSFYPLKQLLAALPAERRSLQNYRLLALRTSASKGRWHGPFHLGPLKRCGKGRSIVGEQQCGCCPWSCRQAQVYSPLCWVLRF